MVKKPAGRPSPLPTSNPIPPLTMQCVQVLSATVFRICLHPFEALCDRHFDYPCYTEEMPADSRPALSPELQAGMPSCTLPAAPPGPTQAPYSFLSMAPNYLPNPNNHHFPIIHLHQYNYTVYCSQNTPYIPVSKLSSTMDSYKPAEPSGKSRQPL